MIPMEHPASAYSEHKTGVASATLGFAMSQGLAPLGLAPVIFAGRLRCPLYSMRYSITMLHVTVLPCYRVFCGGVSVYNKTPAQTMVSYVICKCYMLCLYLVLKKNREEEGNQLTNNTNNRKRGVKKHGNMVTW